MTAAIVIPWSDTDCPHRLAARDRVHSHLATHLPDWPIVECGPTPFSRSAALNMGMEFTDAEVVVTLDADLLIRPSALRKAVELAAERPGLVIPFDRLLYVHERETQTILRQPSGQWPRPVRPWRWTPTDKIPLLGGCGVLSRETWGLAGGWLEQFHRWGGQDVAFAAQCSTLVAPLRRIEGDAVHLFHPKDGDYVDPDQIAANRERMARVLAAEGDPDAMEALVRELRYRPEEIPA